MPYTLIRSNRKSISLTIDCRGPLVVRAPRGAGKDRIEALIREKESWILAGQEVMAAYRAQWAPLTCAPGERLLYRGRWMALAFSGVEKITPMEDTLFLPLGTNLETLRHWVREQARAMLTEAVARRSREMGISCGAPKLTEAKGRWGSCSRENVIRLSWRLVLCTPEAAEYVVVHELCHLCHKNHSQAFWAAVAESCPDWRGQREWLRENRGVMELL